MSHNSFLQLDEMISFNPHLLYKNITDTLLKDKEAATCAATKHVLVSRTKEPLMSFYKARASYFYGAEAASVDFSSIDQEVADRINSKAERQTGGQAADLVTAADRAALELQPSIAVVAGNFFRGRFAAQPAASSLNYINLPRGRRLVPVEALSWAGPLKAGYEPGLDCTAVEVPYKGGELSLVLLLPGQVTQFLTQGLQQLEQRIDSDGWETLLR
jgi:serine protease inhibitor